MQKLIPTIYFYLLSAVGMALIIVGLFNAIHFVIGSTLYEKYPLPQGFESRCEYLPAKIVDGGPTPVQDKKECLGGVEKDRVEIKRNDLENSFKFLLIGSLVFGFHFKLARKKS